MYVFLLDLHNLLRWVVVIVGLAALVMAWTGAAARARWTPQQANLGRIFTIAVDLQFLVGLLLYVGISPVMRQAFRDFGAAMADDGTRFFLVEHAPMMLVALILFHVGGVRGRKTDSPLQAAIFYTLGLAIVAFAIPWGRPLFPGLG